MNAIFNAHRLSSNICLARENPTAPPESLTDPTGTFGKSAVFGFPYLDTLKLLEHGSISGGAIFYSKGDDEELQQLEERLRLGSTDESDLEPLQAVFCDQPIAQPAAAVGTGSVGTESRFALGGRRYCWLRLLVAARRRALEPNGPAGHSRFVTVESLLRGRKLYGRRAHSEHELANVLRAQNNTRRAVSNSHRCAHAS